MTSLNSLSTSVTPYIPAQSPHYLAP